MNSDNQIESWNTSYLNGDNHLFYPSEEVVRFAAKYIRKRIQLNKFLDIQKDLRNFRILDLGCGIGRHHIYFESLGVSCFGIDLSARAIELAQKWSSDEGISQKSSKLIQGDLRSLPYSNQYFDCAISVGVFDSMHYSVAKQCIPELWRVLKEDSLLYVDLISMNSEIPKDEKPTQSRRNSKENEEIIVKTLHEKDTIQSYYNIEKIQGLFCGYFEILEHWENIRRDFMNEKQQSRHGLVLKRVR